MKFLYVISFLLGVIIRTVSAQDKEEFSFSELKLRGQTFVGLASQVSSNNRLNNYKYRNVGLNLSISHYLTEKLSVAGEVAGQQYKTEETLVPVIKEFSDKTLVLYKGQIRYNLLSIYDKGEGKEFGKGVIFIRAGYGFGSFTDKQHRKLNKWEILTAGGSLFTQVKNQHIFGLDAGIGIEKDNLNSSLAIPIFINLNFSLGKKIKSIKQL